jgi:hypothetical protein
MILAPAFSKLVTFCDNKQVPRLVRTRNWLRSGVPTGNGLQASATRSAAV